VLFRSGKQEAIKQMRPKEPGKGANIDEMV